MKLKHFGAIIAVLLVLMVGASVILVASSDSGRTFPSATNKSPSGLGAFAELLRRDGYKVAVETDIRPNLQPGDLAIAPRLSEQVTSFQQAMQGDEIPTIDKSLDSFVDKGGTVLELGYGPDFASSTRLSENTKLQLGSKSYEVTTQSADPGAVVPATVSNEDNSSFSSWTKEKGRYVDMTDGLGATNRFLDRADNAAYYLDLVRSFAKPGSRIVFTEASFGHATERGLLTEIGPWAPVAFWQLILVIVVGLFAVGRRFGLPVPDRFYERGTNELVAAMGGALRRSRKHDQALMIMLDDAYERIRNAVRAPMGTDPAALTRMAPEPLAQVITRIRSTYGAKVAPSDAVNLAAMLESRLRAFEAEAKSEHSRGLTLK